MSVAVAIVVAMELSEHDHAILAFEAAHPTHEGGKELEIERRFGMRPPRYYSIVRVILANPAALAERPADVRRLQRIWAERVEARRDRTFRSAA